MPTYRTIEAIEASLRDARASVHLLERELEDSLASCNAVGRDLVFRLAKELVTGNCVVNGVVGRKGVDGTKTEVVALTSETLGRVTVHVGT